MLNETQPLPSDWNVARISAVRKALVNWFRANRRPLPWRDDADPYKVWVSEVMLQQTTVTAVIPYYQKFIQRFPTIETLAEAKEEEVLKLWEGLGYYRRARHLHQAAKILFAKVGNRPPADDQLWASLPGVGRYILGAVMSQAYSLPFPIVEANSLRVWARMCGYPQDPRSGEGNKWVWAAARRLMPRKNSGDFNQGVMELGQTICKTDNPQCDICPVAFACIAKKKKLQASIPPKPKAKEINNITEVACAIRNKNDEVLVGKRPNDARWAGLWEFPHYEWKDDEDIKLSLVRLAHEDLGIRVKPDMEVTTITHAITTDSITVDLWDCMLLDGEVKSEFFEEWKWVPVKELKNLATSKPQRQLFDAFSQRSRQLRLA